MIYVLDSNVAVKWVLTEALSDKAQLLRDDFKNNFHQLISPDILPAEIIHALTRAERQNRISPPEGGKLFADIMSTPPRFFQYQPLIPRAYVIASQAKIGVYDCLYVALSEQENCQLVTADDRLVKVLQPQFPQIIHLASLP
ncbi:MAG TPA: type II toxin-antitoxin system VapC family toxin [Gemmataceae bacterium]|jgi:predicted nucleic acid-binding protein|nr:type II toxin-antitoxin system VapC family toxin [Gemmataceae bacterium]